MATSPHQPQSLSDRITELKAELATYIAARDQILALGQSTAGGGVSTNHAEISRLEHRIDWLRAQIAALTDQLNGDSDRTQPGVVLPQFRSEYA